MILKSNNENSRYVSYEEKKEKARKARTPRISKDLDSALDDDFEVLESASTMKIIDLISDSTISLTRCLNDILGFHFKILLALE